MPKVDKSAAGDIEGIVPAVRVSVLPFFLYPLDALVEGREFNLAIRQINVFQSSLVPFTPALRLKKEIQSDASGASKLGWSVPLD